MRTQMRKLLRVMTTTMMMMTTMKMLLRMEKMTRETRMKTAMRMKMVRIVLPEEPRGSMKTRRKETTTMMTHSWQLLVHCK